MRNVWKAKSRHTVLGQAVLPVCCFAVLLALFLYGMSDASEGVSDKRLRVTAEAIRRAVVHCYAVEGAYPPDIGYLETHYGVLIDHDKYLVTYEAFASNVMPQIQIVEKGW